MAGVRAVGKLGSDLLTVILVSTTAVEAVFQSINQELEKDNTIREAIKTTMKEIDQLIRQAQYTLQHVHTNPKSVKEVVSKVMEFFPSVKTQFASLQGIVSGEQYYKFSQLWKHTVQQCVSIAAFCYWVESKTLLTIEHVEQLLGFPGKEKGANPLAWAVELEDFLIGVSFLPSELSRLCLNAVIVQDYETPKAIYKFVSDLFAGFRLLNLKNDFLRKRFDSIKYDMKRIEEILYEIEIRKLGKSESAPATQ